MPEQTFPARLVAKINRVLVHIAHMKLSLRTAVVLAILLGLLLPASISGYLNARQALQHIETELKLTHQRYADILVLGMQDPLWNLAPEAGKPLLESLISDESVVRITVSDASLGTFLSVNHPERRLGHLLTLTRAINKQGASIGTVAVEMDDGLATRQVKAVQQQYLLVTLLQVAISLALTLFLLHSRILRPLQRLIRQTTQLAPNELQTSFKWHRHDEIGQLGQCLEDARKTLLARFEEFKQKNIQMEANLLSHQQIESSLLAGQNRYRHFVENTPLIPWEANPAEWRFTYIGPQAEALFGHPISNWHSEGFLSNYLHPDDRHLAFELFTDTQQDTHQLECRLITQDGRENWILLIATAQIESEQRRLQGFIIDIHARKQVDLELEKYRIHLEETLESCTRTLTATNHELDAFSHAVSHDLRAPLRTIDGFSQVLLEDYGDTLDVNARHYLQRIRSAINTMAELIDNLLSLSAFSRSEIHNQPINISEIAQDIAEQLNALQLDQWVTFEITPNMYADADPKLIQIVLHNLLDNACKYSAQSPAAHVRFGVTVINHRQVYYVSDNGIGFDMNDANKLFRPFQRLHANHGDYSGNGIGLAIVQRIIALHEGHIWAKSAPNEGATFYFTLPATKKTS